MIILSLGYKKATPNPFVKNTIVVWYEVLKHIGQIPELSQFTPIWGNTMFTPGTHDGGFKIWASKGLNKVADLFNDETMLSFQELRHKFDLPKTHFFKYLQIRNFINKTQHLSLLLPELSPLERITLNHLNGAGQVSLFYKLISTNCKENTEKKRLAWCQDISENITEDEWQSICLKAQTQTINTRFKLLQYKWIMRVYITPELLHKFNPNIPNQCIKCNSEMELYSIVYGSALKFNFIGKRF